MLRKWSTHRKCLANHCFMLVKPSAVFCRSHWNQLSEAVQEAIQRAILWGKHDEAATLVTEAIRYLDTHKTPSRP